LHKWHKPEKAEIYVGINGLVDEWDSHMMHSLRLR